ncbi:MAG: hypothetical protein LUI85_00795 [Bacteroides sp.]|nr:hypothetical protein [Bacteroides sp.]
MEEKNYYFVSKESIYDYAMLLHLPQPDGSTRDILVKVNNNEEINIYPADTTEEKEVLDFQKSWLSLDFEYYEKEFNQIIMPPTVMDKMPEVIKRIADETGCSVEVINKMLYS